MNDAPLQKPVDSFRANINFNVRRELAKVVRSALANGKLPSGDTLTTAVTVANQ
jgi:hypothetical protein